MAERKRSAGLDARLDRTMMAEGLARLRLTAIAVTIALAAIAPIVTLVTGFPDAVYYYLLLAIFGCSTWAQYLLARRSGLLLWHALAFTAFNFALLTFVLIYPNPLSEMGRFEFGPAMMLRFNNFVYFFILLAALGFNFSPLVMLWGGFCGAVFWSVGRWWIATRPGMIAPIGDPAGPDATLEQHIAAALRPEFMDLGIWVQECAVFLIVSGLLALVVAGSRTLVRRQAMLERRGANLARYLPAELAERMAEADAPFMSDREVQAAVLFTDVVGFTGWAEAREPGEVVALLREVHALAAREIFRAGGVLDKFIGDGTMATFGAAPSVHGEGDPGEPARRALACAEGLLEASAIFNRGRAERGLEPVRLSVGLHFGPVVVGDVGGAGRMEMSVVGDTVNVASRIERLTRTLDCGAVATGKTIDAAGGPPPGWRDVGRHRLPGRAADVQVWARDFDADDPERNVFETL